MKLLGRFYFKKTSNGNLIGEFSNNMSPEIYTESADLILDAEKETDKYPGNYKSTWRENNTPNFAHLEISPDDDNNKLFILKWTNKKGDLLFEGKGMLCDNIMIGDYQ